MKPDSSHSKTRWFEILFTVIISVLGILVGQFFSMMKAPDEFVVCIYLLCVVIIASVTTGYAYAIISSLIYTAAYNYFICLPKNEWQSLTANFILTTSMFFIFAILISSITSKVKEGETIARRREEEMTVLYHLTKDLAGVGSIEEAIDITLLNVAKVFKTNCRILKFNQNEEPMQTFVLLEDGRINKQAITDQTRDFAEYKTRPELGYFQNKTQCEWPMYSRSGTLLAALAIPNKTVKKMNTLDLRIVNTMVEAAGMAFERLILAANQHQANMMVNQERYRTNLLRSISHDLRTPLAGISGTAEVLMEELGPESNGYEMAKNIRNETAWLYNMVQNVLSLSKLQNEQFAIKADVNVLEDIVESAVETMKIRLPEREIITKYPLDEVIAAKLDPSLMKQVLINLLDNANKYSPMSEPIEVIVQKAEDDPTIAEILVRDFGVGLSQEALDKIFEMFYTTRATTPGAIRGYGLGLPICDSIMKAHNGSISARNRVDGKQGSVFVLRLPLFDMNSKDTFTDNV